jgi:hypothetical protein
LLWNSAASQNCGAFWFLASYVFALVNYLSKLFHDSGAE